MAERRPVDSGGGWAAHRRAQFMLWASATPAQRLSWLEEMIALAYRTGAFPRRVSVPAEGGRSPGGEPRA